MKKIIKSNWFELLLTIVGVTIYFIYNINMYVELPFETYMERINIIDKFYNGSLTLKDLLEPVQQGGMLGTYLLFLINLKFFHFTVFFENFVNIIIVTIIGCISIWGLKKLVNNKKNVVYFISCITMTMFLYTWMQERCGGMSTQVRLSLGAFVIVAVAFDGILKEQSISFWNYLIYIILIALSINVFGMLYGFAGIPGILFICVFICIKEKKINSVSAVTIVTYICTLVLYRIEYGDALVVAQADSESILDKIIAFFTNPIDTLECIAGWCGSTVLGHYCLEDGYINEKQYFIVGIIMTIIFVVSFFCFFKIKMYEKTWLPFLFYAYFVILFAEIYVARPGGLGWFTNSWYLVHGKLAIVATIWIWNYAFLNTESRARKNIIYKIGVVCLDIVLSATLCIGSYYTYIRLPYEKSYLLQRQMYMFAEDISELPEENGMTPLLQSPEVSMNAIEVYKKYGLSLYRDYASFLEMQKITGRYNEWGSTIDTCYFKDGIGSDYMAEKHAEIKIKTQDDGYIVMNISWIQEVAGRDVDLTVSCDGKEIEVLKIESSGSTEYTVSGLPKNQIVTIELDTKDSRVQQPDVRELSYRLNDINAY